MSRLRVNRLCNYVLLYAYFFFLYFFLIWIPNSIHAFFDPFTPFSMLKPSKPCYTTSPILPVGMLSAGRIDFRLFFLFQSSNLTRFILFFTNPIYPPPPEPALARQLNALSTSSQICGMQVQFAAAAAAGHPNGPKVGGGGVKRR